MLEGRCFRAPPMCTLHPRGCGWTSPAQGCTHRRLLASAPRLTGRKSIFRIRRVLAASPRSHPVSHHRPSHCRGTGATALVPTTSPNPALCPLALSRPAGLSNSSGRSRGRGRGQDGTTSVFPLRFQNTPGAPLRVR